ncbi:MAG: hypothetical protein AB2533_13790 [Candidatus Thiodiazotropha endolucinida]
MGVVVVDVFRIDQAHHRRDDPVHQRHLELIAVGDLDLQQVGVLDVDAAVPHITLAPAQVAVGDTEVDVAGARIDDLAAELVEGLDGGVDDLDLGEAAVLHIQAGAGDRRQRFFGAAVATEQGCQAQPQLPAHGVTLGVVDRALAHRLEGCTIDYDFGIEQQRSLQSTHPHQQQCRQ